MRDQCKPCKGTGTVKPTGLGLAATCERCGGTGYPKRAQSLAPKPRQPQNEYLAELQARLASLFRDAAQRPFCPICHSPAVVPLHAHHCLDASFLDGELAALVTPERMIGIRFDTRNALGACAQCHMDDHWSMWRRIGRKHIPPSAFELARELDALVGDQRFTARLERYPEQVKEAA